MKKLVIIMAAALICCCLSCKKKVTDPAALSGDLAKLTEAIAADSTNAELYYLRAQYYYDNKQIENAEKDILRCVALDNTQAKYYVLMSDVYFAQKETDLTEENLQRAIEIDADFNEARLKLAELYYYERMYDECMTAIDEASKRNPHNPTAYLIKAFCYKELQDTANYLRMLYLVKDQNPQEIKAHMELGYFYQQKKSPEAIPHYQNALIIDPNNEVVNYNLALLYSELGDMEKAKEQYNILLSVAKEGIYAKNALYNLGYISANIDGDYEQAISYFTKAIEMDNLFTEAYYGRGEAYEQTGKYAEARNDYERCLKITTNYEPAIAGLNALDKKQ